MARSWLPRRARTSGTPADHVVTLVTRADCHLCDDAHSTLAAMSTELGFALEVLDVDADRQRREQYGDLVPVVLIDGRQHGYWRVEPERLRAALTAG